MKKSEHRGDRLKIEREKLKEQLIRDEGLKLKPYRCTADKLTIGVGRNLEDVGISEDEAMYMLGNDIMNVEAILDRTFKWFNNLDSVRQDVLINMAFNMGIAKFLGFKRTIAYIEKGEYEEASVEMLNSLWAKQVGDRALRLSKQIREGRR